MNKVPAIELKSRMLRFKAHMDKLNPDWEMAVIFSKINMYYFTGTMQDGFLMIRREAKSTLWVRRSYERAMDESEFPTIRQMNSFKDAALDIESLPETVYIETEVVPMALYQRFHKYFPFKAFKSLDAQVSYIRSIKSQYELTLMKKSGEIHRRVLEERLPELLQEGMSETELTTSLYSVLVEEGHHGVSRFGMFDTEMVLGQIGFGESSIYPSYFNGPGGNYGMSPAVPLLGRRERKLNKGDLVFVDVGCGVDGYHTDKTITCMFGRKLPKEAIDIHKKCVEVQYEIASMLKPGETPANIYNTIISKLDKGFLGNFMGFGNRRVKFLGHGIGLVIDEWPVIADGFKEPLQEGMVIALEPKSGVSGIGMVGIENTFMVTPKGGLCITGDNPGLIPVYQ